MGIFDYLRVFADSEEEMAKKSASRKDAGQPSEAVANFVARLARTGTDRGAFDREFSALKDETSLSAAEVIAIAHGYAGGGKKAASKMAAYSSISKRFVELARFQAKNKVAEKSRPW